MAYVVVVVRSSGFHTLFEVESWGAVLLNRVMSLQNTHRSGALEMRTYAQYDRDCALCKHLEREMAFFGTLIETTEKCFFFRTGVAEHHDLRGATQIRSLAPIWRFGE
jgi:hypothetical protein